MTKYLFKTVTSLAGGKYYIHQYQSVNKVLTRFSYFSSEDRSTLFEFLRNVEDQEKSCTEI